MFYNQLYWFLPDSTGKRFYVAPTAAYNVDGTEYTASDGNNGKDPRRAFRTIDGAIGNGTASDGDTFILLPGAHSISASIAADVAGIKLIGVPGNPLYPRTTLACTAVDQTINVTAADIEIANIAFLATTSQASALLDFSAAASRFYIHDCVVDFTPATAATTILGFDAIGAAAYTMIKNCRFVFDGAFGAAVDMTATVDGLIEGCDIVVQTGTLAAGITTGAATDRCYIRRCTFLDGEGTITAGIDGTGATIANGVIVHDCRFGVGVTVPIDNFDAGECAISENYDFGIGSTDGGVLITAIT